MINIGDVNTKVYIGDTEAKVYIGDELIYPTGQHDYSQDYLTFKITASGNIKWQSSSTGITREIQYSNDDGTTWSSITSTTEGVLIPVVVGDTVLFKGNNSRYATSLNDYTTFGNSSAGFEVCGNIMSLISGDGFTSATTLSQQHTFAKMFLSCSGLSSAENLTLPATALTDNCYDSMFRGSRNLTTAPELPAPTLQWYSYEYMFSGCTSLNYIKCLATNISAFSCTANWVRGVAASGTFVKASTMST